MPRQNKPRAVFAEDHLARRVAAERESRGWTYDGLASRMTRAGCPMAPSAIFKTEKSQPRRRIVVDELVAYSKVFGVPIEELLLPPEIVMRNDLIDLVLEHEEAKGVSAAAWERVRESTARLREYVDENPDAEDALEGVYRVWVDAEYSNENQFGALAYRMWDVTQSARWQDELMRATGRG